MMIHASGQSQQPLHTAWTRKCLLHERAIALGHAINLSLAQTYNSHLQSYLTFCKLRDFPIDPTTDTLSLYVVFMCPHINPKSISAYLSGICSMLEPHFPSIRKTHHDTLMKCSLARMKKLHGGTGPNRKCPLSEDDLHLLLRKYDTSEYNDKLFLVILLTGFHRLMCLSELTQPNAKARRLFSKLTMQHTLKIMPATFSFHLPYHKGDHFFEGNTILIEAQTNSLVCPHKHLSSYIANCDHRFPLYPELWLTTASNIPTYSWFVKRLQNILGSNVAGHLLKSGGATALALMGVCNDLIQAINRWASDVFQIYIQKHPVLLQALIHGKPAFSSST
jgi:hypothetical protein